MYTQYNQVISIERLSEILDQIDTAKVGLIGDLCLDMYWLADMRLSELSRETPHYPLPVVEERYAPGGAGNVACNLAALKPKILCVAGIIGDDWRGDLLLKALKERDIDTKLVVRDHDAVTNTYIKPLRRGISEVTYEDPRLDFENRNAISQDCESKLLQSLEIMAQRVDVICVSDQMKYGCITPGIRERICALGREGKTIIVDSRDRIALYDHVTVKPNEIEAMRGFDGKLSNTLDDLSSLAEKIAEKNERLTLMTLGDQGCFVADEGSVTHCRAFPVEPPIVFCGAGDTFLAGFGVLLAAGIDPVTAARIANLCSAVTIKKLGTTGTATRAELIAAYRLYKSP